MIRGLLAAFAVVVLAVVGLTAATTASATNNAVASAAISVGQATCAGPNQDTGGSFEYTVTVASDGPARNFQVKNLGDGTGGSAETSYYPDGTTGGPGEVVVFATVQPGDTATLSLDGLPAGHYRVVSDGSQQVKQYYKRDFTIDEIDCGVPALQVDRSAQVPGGTVSLTALGFRAGEEVTFVMNSPTVLLGMVVADGTGVAQLGSITIPTTVPVGTHTIVATGGWSSRIASVTFEVLAADDPATPAAAAAPAAPATPAAAAAPTAQAAPRSSLASTGGQFATLLGTAGALTLAGIALVAVRRRSTVRA